VAEWADLVPLMNETGEIDETVIETELGYVSEALGITHDPRPTRSIPTSSCPEDQAGGGTPADLSASTMLAAT
jgi:hypothetical protein